MKFFIFLILVIINTTYAQRSYTADIPEGFKINDEYINPQCLQQLQTSLAENSNIIMQAVVLETCQNSNLGLSGHQGLWYNEEAVGFEDPDSNRTFIYKYEGTISDTMYLISHHSDLAIYEITQAELGFDVSKDDYRSVHILSKLAHVGYFHCFLKAEIADNTIIVKKALYHEDKPRSEACDLTKSERIKIDISKIKAN